MFRCVLVLQREADLQRLSVGLGRRTAVMTPWPSLAPRDSDDDDDGNDDDSFIGYKSGRNDVVWWCYRNCWCLLQFAYTTAYRMKDFITWCLICEYDDHLLNCCATDVELKPCPHRASTQLSSGVVRKDLLRFLAWCHTRRLNQALSLLCFSLDFLSVSVVLLTSMDPFCIVLLCVICVFCLLVVIRLSVPVQVIDWKDSSPKWPLKCW